MSPAQRVITVEEMRELRDLLKDFAKEEKRILEQSKALLEKKVIAALEDRETIARLREQINDLRYSEKAQGEIHEAMELVYDRSCDRALELTESRDAWRQCATELVAHLREVDGCGCIAGDDAMATFERLKREEG